MAEKEYIARISYGKDSLKMLEVIKSRGLPLDRITTTDVWATDTISANLPPMDAFKERMDQRIWDMYRIQVEHLCARNKDGSKKTYEQMFYHVPVRKSGGVQARNNQRIPGHLESVVSSGTQAESQDIAFRERLLDSHRTRATTIARNSSTSISRDFPFWDALGAGGNSSIMARIQGFPATISPWCRKLKIDKVTTPFSTARPDGPKEISWSISA